MRKNGCTSILIESPKSCENRCVNEGPDLYGASSQDLGPRGVLPISTLHKRPADFSQQTLYSSDRAIT